MAESQGPLATRGRKSKHFAPSFRFSCSRFSIRQLFWLAPSERRSTGKPQISVNPPQGELSQTIEFLEGFNHSNEPCIILQVLPRELVESIGGAEVREHFHNQAIVNRKAVGVVLAAIFRGKRVKFSLLPA